MKKNSILVLFAAILFSCSENKEQATEQKKDNGIIETHPVHGNVVQATFKVWGNCETCKDAIENSLRADGISNADWNIETKLISVTYDSTKINLDKIEQKIAAAGYDNAKYKGDDKAYENLPACRKYERK